MNKLPTEVVDIISKTVGSMMKSSEFTECCFRYPKSIKHLKI